MLFLKTEKNPVKQTQNLYQFQEVEDVLKYTSKVRWVITILWK